MRANLCPHTLAALAVWKEGCVERQHLWNAVPDNEGAADQVAIDRVQDAYYEDTKHVNSREHCKLTTIRDLKWTAGLPPDTHRAAPIKEGL